MPKTSKKPFDEQLLDKLNRFGGALKSAKGVAGWLAQHAAECPKGTLDALIDVLDTEVAVIRDALANPTDKPQAVKGDFALAVLDSASNKKNTRKK